jgi:hypothetical protein
MGLDRNEETLGGAKNKMNSMNQNHKGGKSVGGGNGKNLTDLSSIQ